MEARYCVPRLHRSPMHCFDSGFAQGTLRGPVRQGSLAQATCPGAAGVGGADADTEDSGQGVMRDARGEVERVEDGKESVGMDSGAALCNYGVLGSVECGSGSTYSRHPLPVAVQERWGLCSLAHPHC